MKVAIHQPNFFPWLGYFDKIIKSDIFVFLDDVAYPKSGNSMGSWTNRVKLMVQGKAYWINCPVVREHGEQIIKNVKINNSIKWRDKLLKTIEYNYKKCICYNDIMMSFYDIINRDCDRLAEYNINNILSICSMLNIKTRFVRQSEIDTIGTSTDLLIEITKKLEADTYICGGGASGYQEDWKFHNNGIDISYQSYIHPEYSQQGNEFISGLSIIDVLFNCGIEGVKDILGIE